MKRIEIISELERLLTDEYDASELIYCSKSDLIQKLIEVADYYRYEFNNRK